jgi:hypothetical protein
LALVRKIIPRAPKTVRDKMILDAGVDPECLSRPEWEIANKQLPKGSAIFELIDAAAGSMEGRTGPDRQSAIAAMFTNNLPAYMPMSDLMEIAAKHPGKFHRNRFHLQTRSTVGIKQRLVQLSRTSFPRNDELIRDFMIRWLALNEPNALDSYDAPSTSEWCNDDHCKDHDHVNIYCEKCWRHLSSYWDVTGNTVTVTPGAIYYSNRPGRSHKFGLHQENCFTRINRKLGVTGETPDQTLDRLVSNGHVDVIFPGVGHMASSAPLCVAMFSGVGDMHLALWSDYEGMTLDSRSKMRPPYEPGEGWRTMASEI